MVAMSMCVCVYLCFGGMVGDNGGGVGGLLFAEVFSGFRVYGLGFMV